MVEFLMMIIRILAVYLPFIIFYMCALTVSLKISFKYDLYNNYVFINKYENVFITFADELLFAIQHLSISLVILHLLVNFGPMDNRFIYDLLLSIPIVLEFYIGMSALEFVLNFIRTTRGK